MERREQLTGDTLGRACVLIGTHHGPFVDLGMRPPTEAAGRWLVSRKAVVAMARLLGLPQGADVDALERECEALHRRLEEARAEVEALRRVLAAQRRMLGLDGVPSVEELDAAEQAVREFETELTTEPAS